MCLAIGGDLIASVSPLAQATLLYIDVRGRADSGVLSAIERQGYTELNAVVSASDLQPGIIPSPIATSASSRSRAASKRAVRPCRIVLTYP